MTHQVLTAVEMVVMEINMVDAVKVVVEQVDIKGMERDLVVIHQIMDIVDVVVLLVMVVVVMLAVRSQSRSRCGGEPERRTRGLCGRS